MAELVDAQDLKSWEPSACTGSIPVPGTSKIRGLRQMSVIPFLMLGRTFCRNTREYPE